VEACHSKKRKLDKKKDYKKKRPLCWDCESPGHLKYDCLNPEKKKKMGFKKFKFEGKENFVSMILLT